MISGLVYSVPRTCTERWIHARNSARLWGGGHRGGGRLLPLTELSFREGGRGLQLLGIDSRVSRYQEWVPKPEGGREAQAPGRPSAEGTREEAVGESVSGDTTVCVCPTCM